MIHVTDDAAQGLQEILAANDTPKDQGVKLVPSDGGGISMTIDRPQEGDAVVDDRERPLLIVDASFASELDGVVFDVAGGAKGGEPRRFVLRRAEATP